MRATRDLVPPAEAALGGPDRSNRSTLASYDILEKLVGFAVLRAYEPVALAFGTHTPGGRAPEPS